MARRPKPWFRKERQAWFVTLNGAQHNLGPDRNQAYERFYELMRQPVAKKVSPQSVVAIIDEFLDWCSRHRAPATYEWYRYRLQRFSQRYPDLRVTDLRPYHVEKWADSYELAQTSRRNYLRSVKRCMGWARRQGYVEVEPLAGLEVPSGERKDVVITPGEYATFVAALRDECFRDLVEVTWQTGCRPQESLRVEARHVDVQRQRWVFPRTEAKGKKKPRIVYLSDHALAITMKFAERHPDGPLFRNSAGRSWTKEAAGCAFNRAQIRLGKQTMQRLGVIVSTEEVAVLIPRLNPMKRSRGSVIAKTDSELRSEARQKLTNRLAASHAPRYSLYALRHSWATKALESGMDGLTVAVLMGHDDPSTLAKVYQHLAHNPQHMLEQARKASAS